MSGAWHFSDRLIFVQVTLGMHFWSGLAMVFTLLVQVLVILEHECFLYILPLPMQSLRQPVAHEAHSGCAGRTAFCLWDQILYRSEMVLDCRMMQASPMLTFLLGFLCWG